MEVRDGAREGGGGPAYRQPLLARRWENNDQCKHCYLQINSLKLGEELSLFVLAVAHVAPAAPSLGFFFPCPWKSWDWGPRDRGEVRPRHEAPGPQMKVQFWPR